MKILLITLSVFLFSCMDEKTAIQESRNTEINQEHLNKVQPAPRITYSLERENLIKRFKLMNDRSILFYMYIFIEGIGEPIGYYQVNKVSSVNSQLTNTEQIVYEGSSKVVLPSPAEDGSYGTNGDGVFGFSPEGIYLEHNMKYIVSTVPLNFKSNPQKLTVINLQTQKDLDVLMNNIK